MEAELALESTRSAAGLQDDWFTSPPPGDVSAGYDFASSPVDDSFKWIKTRRPEEEDAIVPSGYQYVSGSKT